MIGGLVVLAFILGGLALWADQTVFHLLGVACVGLVLIVQVEEVTLRRRLTPRGD